MRATLLKETLKSLFPVRRTVCIEGAPGGGKTTIVHEVAQELGIPCIERHMPTMLVEDFGILFPEGDGAKLSYKLPDWFPVKGKAPQQGILLFDDRNQASADLQKVLANICQARTLHGVPMPDGWQVISTGNRQSDRAGANRVLGHLRNRETVIELETHLDDFTQWALDHNVKPEVISFTRFRPGLLHDYDPQRDQNATPRSWVEGVSPTCSVPCRQKPSSSASRVPSVRVQQPSSWAICGSSASCPTRTPSCSTRPLARCPPTPLRSTLWPVLWPTG
jgi:hypothetical protein